METIGKTLALVALCALPLLAQANSLDDIKSRGVLRVATTVDAAPWGFTDAAGKPTGLDVELAQKLADNMGVKLQLQQVTGANRIPYLMSRKVDVLIAALGSSPERAKLVNFSEPYAAVYLGVYGGSDVKKVTKLSDLGNATIAVPKGSTPDLTLSDQYPQGNYLRLEDTASAVSAFLAGQAPMFAENNLIAQKVAQENPAKHIELKYLLRKSPAYIAIRPGQPELMTAINQFIDKSTQDGELPALRQKWFNDAQNDLKTEQ
ncbi:transporter substrate-binding domain-containing protein [Pantoea phytobeneficialis]|uniref:ABC transporter substrate-binding protein n=1 Tax=Pantoea phytobeneficialis TaxID=2052056 RepID=A0AAP9KRV7_9GAMM|nr:transporter substrate-binding domain-containing protein [Pantoea phytobeneficialis]MDO6407492.1 transporter substrate-binding domain-containing protein [Pantoea phytobeneficialis]QGR09460.1 ABC transporter substrate-binding protein [Pantoea phytobeneficialis]